MAKPPSILQRHWLRGGRRVRACAAAWLLGAGTAGVAATSPAFPADTAPLSREPAVREALTHLYDLDYGGALQRFGAIARTHAGDPMATDYILQTTIFQELYRLNLLDTTLYAHDGFFSGKRPVAEDHGVSHQVDALTEQATHEADARLHADAKDVNALYARAWARSLRAVYVGLVERGFISALRQAVQARNDDDRVLQMDPGYVDAELVIGVHQYLLGSLPLGFRLMAGLAGMHGDKQKGIALLREDGQRGAMTSVEARTALMLFLRREGRYGDAAEVARTLAVEYPHNFLFALEAANLQKDAGEASVAIAQYRRVLAQARTPGYFPNAHLELAWFALGETLRGQKDHKDAAKAFTDALRQPEISPDLKRRAELEAGEEFDTINERAKAIQEYQKLVDESPDSPQAAEARRDLTTAFTTPF